MIFVIRARRVPFFRSRPSVPLTLAAIGIVALGAVLPYTPLAHVLGFRPLPGTFFAALAGMVICHLVLIEIGKYWFFRFYHAPPRHRTPGHRVRRCAARFAAHTLHPAHSHDASAGTLVRPGGTAPAG